jgi:hypothetical protein
MAASIRGLLDRYPGLPVVVVIALLFVVPLTFVGVVLLGATSGTTLARWELSGDPERGFSGVVPFPPKADRVTLTYSFVLKKASSTTPEAHLLLELLDGDDVKATSRCSTAKGASPSMCQTGGSRRNLDRGQPPQPRMQAASRLRPQPIHRCSGSSAPYHVDHR